MNRPGPGPDPGPEAWSDATQRFAALFGGPDDALPLDLANLLMANHADPTVDVGAQLDRIDAIANSCREPTLDGLIDHLFRRLKFTGDTSSYYDPRNSFLPDVLDRKLGLPITLCVLTMEVGRRIGAPLWGVGLPGHFILRDKVDHRVFVDPFHDGVVLDAAACERLFRAMAGPDTAWDPDYLQPVPRTAIVARMLGNLRGTYARMNDLGNLWWVARLRKVVPGMPKDELDADARLLARTN